MATSGRTAAGQPYLFHRQPTTDNRLLTSSFQPSGLRSQVSGLRSQVSALSPQPSGLRSQVSGLRSQVSGLRSQVSALRSQVSGLRSQLSTLLPPTTPMATSGRTAAGQPYLFLQKFKIQNSKSARLRAHPFPGVNEFSLGFPRGRRLEGRWSRILLKRFTNTPRKPHPAFR
jgi:hypothetical protein